MILGVRMFPKPRSLTGGLTQILFRRRKTSGDLAEEARKEGFDESVRFPSFHKHSDSFN